MNRDENGIVTATTNTEDIIGWTADQILRTMMGVDEPTDQATADRLNRLRQLREKETLTPEEESELNELRRTENADLLSKGDSPLAVRQRPIAERATGTLFGFDAGFPTFPPNRLVPGRSITALRWIDRGPEPDEGSPVRRSGTLRLGLTTSRTG